jgi:uncharacterized delta-60 repeat protein/uncharacterized repeat protein (TIGR01451 family)
MEEDAMLARFSRRLPLTLVGTLVLVIAIASPAAAPPGDLDTTFDSDGLVTTDFAGSIDEAFAVAIQGDGKIVAAGFVVVSDGTNDFALARYNADGSLDTTFDGDGKVTTDFAGSSDQAFAVAIQGDGKIVAAGFAHVSGTNDFAVARYNAAGSLDTTFSGDGKVTTDFAGGHDLALDVALQGDGKIVAGGGAFVSGAEDFALARYNAAGSLDTTFDGDGKVTTDLAGGTDEADAVAIQGDGKIVAAGLAFVSGTFDFDFAVARYNADGSLDTTFDGDGKVTTDLAGSIDEAFAVAIQGDGKIVVAGRAVVSGTDDFALARYNSDGSLDTTFDTDGKVTTDFASSNEQAHGVALQGDGKIVAAGYAFVSGANDFALARYQSKGTADLALTKTDPPGRAPTGRNMTYTLTVTNNGPDAASGVTVTDQLPPSVTFVSATPSQGSCSESGGIVTCSLGTLGNGAAATVNIVVKPTTAGTITNTASVTAFDQDPNQGNNADSENTSVCRITSRRSSIPCG